MIVNLHLTHASDRPRRTPSVPNDIRIGQVHRVCKLSVFFVNGERVRDELDVDFTMGGSGARYTYIPKYEIWIDNAMIVEDKMATCVHEIVERHHMMNGDTYNVAHDKANLAEVVFRYHVDDGEINVNNFDVKQIVNFVKGVLP